MRVVGVPDEPLRSPASHGGRKIFLRLPSGVFGIECEPAGSVLYPFSCYKIVLIVYNSGGRDNKRRYALNPAVCVVPLYALAGRTALYNKTPVALSLLTSPPFSSCGRVEHGLR